MLNMITKDVRKISTVRQKKQIIKQLGKNRDPTKKKLKKKKKAVLSILRETGKYTITIKQE